MLHPCSSSTQNREFGAIVKEDEGREEEDTTPAERPNQAYSLLITQHIHYSSL
jgi:hypothetical protein